MMQNSRGISLVGTMVGVGVLGIVVYTSITMYTNGLLQQKNVEQRYSAMNLHKEIYDQLTNSQSCTATFTAAGQVLNRDNIDDPSTEEFTAITNIKSPDGLTNVFTKYVTAGDPTYENNTIQISGFTLKNYQDQGLVGGRFTATAILEIVYKQNTRTIGPESFKPKQMKIKFTFKNVPVPDAANHKEVHTCSAIGGAGDSFWSLTGAGDGIFYSGGKVGIGTATPAYPLTLDVTSAPAGGTGLQVTGNTAVGGVGVLLNNSIAGGNSWSLVSSGGSSAPVGSFGIYDNGLPGERLVILKTGNVGIGTTTPAAKLSINGNPTQNAGGAAVRLTGTPGSSHSLEIGMNTNYVATANGWLQSWATVGVIPGQLLLNPNGGNVGIGTTAPVSWLHVKASGGSEIMRLENSAGDRSMAIGLDAIGVYFESSHADRGIRFNKRPYGAAAISFAAASNGDYLFAPASDLSNSKVIFKYATGNVGIGTTAPTEKLHLVSSGATQRIMVQESSLGVKTKLVAGIPPDTGLATGKGTVGTESNHPFAISTGDVDRIFITTTGNVGIGTTTPAHTFQVDGTAGLSTGTAWINTSDVRLKDIHGNYEYGLDHILKLNAVRFTYKKNNPLGLPSNHSMTGFIAQEVQKVIPEAVHKNKNGYLELNVDPIHWAVVNSVKELKQLLDIFYEEFKVFISQDEIRNNKIKKLEEENAEMKARLEQIEKAIQAK